jgi:hypothetical protein
MDPINELLQRYYEARAVLEENPDSAEYLQAFADNCLDTVACTRPSTYDGCRRKIIVLAGDEHTNFAVQITETAALMLELDREGDNKGIWNRAVFEARKAALAPIATA